MTNKQMRPTVAVGYTTTEFPDMVRLTIEFRRADAETRALSAKAAEMVLRGWLDDVNYTQSRA